MCCSLGIYYVFVCFLHNKSCEAAAGDIWIFTKMKRAHLVILHLCIRLQPKNRIEPQHLQCKEKKKKCISYKEIQLKTNDGIRKENQIFTSLWTLGLFTN